MTLIHDVASLCELGPTDLHTPDRAKVTCPTCIDTEPKGLDGLLAAVLSGAADDPHLTDEDAAAIDVASPLNHDADTATTAHRRAVIDVTSRLTPGARARAVQRTATMILAADPNGPAVPQQRDPFVEGRAYQQGESIATGKGRYRDRQKTVLRHASTVLAEQGPRAAALVLAGFTGTNPADVR